ncbi:putative E3 ubiquitin-protein ligase LIN-1 isoform X2 [Carica papaya]|uniref:putative E3 ubiquitin-protein ligase LIN-1 isoform X2 n=1 Tax=Carica papaya TaxID=3649 RepID=UPI000B8CF97C|nr:putative E3 ubiquitin-protein ligase LIN-1 isoform X2 [Carica papaya]
MKVLKIFFLMKYMVQRAEKVILQILEIKKDTEKVMEMVQKLRKKQENGSSKHPLGSTSSDDKNRRSMKQPDSADDKTTGGSWKNKSFKDDQNQEHSKFVQTVSEPALDEVAVHAMISILSGHIKCFFKDKDFRTNLHRNCISSLKFNSLEDQNVESKVMANLVEAIATIEAATEQAIGIRELKKASRQLTVITGLSSNDLKDRFTSGIPNFMLSACAHLYLSVIYKLQKKDSMSAKHLLQVFCDSPFQARELLLPELWDFLFFPHLSHLKEWYDQEVTSLVDAPGRLRKLKLLEKVYNEILDSGTSQFALYYRDWLTGRVKAPSVPSIQVPPVPFQRLQKGGSFSHSSEVASPSGPFSPQPMVSRKLYDAVFGRPSKPEVDTAEYNMEANDFEDYVQSSDGSAELKHPISYYSKMVDHLDLELEEGSYKSACDCEFVSEDRLSLKTEEDLKLIAARVTCERHIDDASDSSNTQQKSANSLHILHPSPYLKEKEPSLKSEVQQTEGSVAVTLYNEVLTYNPLLKPTNRSCSFEELHGNCKGFDEGSFFSNIPKDFICPLTGKLLEDPVTLETGQTFEQAAIKEWIDQGNRTCPATGKRLEYLSVPVTNFILKRVIDNWKSENRRHLLDFASQLMGNSLGCGLTQSDNSSIFILEQLLTAFSKEERIANIQHFLSIGGLHYLIRRLELGNLEEKTRVAALLSYCIEADTGCRNQIVGSINIQSLLKLLHGKQAKSRRNAVMLLIELICMSRRKDVSLILSGLEYGEMMKTMHVLLLYLKSSSPVQRPFVAVLLLHFDLLTEPRKCSIYREEAVDAIAVALDMSIVDKKVRQNCCQALLILGGHFSSSGILLTDKWILEKAGFSSKKYLDGGDNLVANNTISLVDEEQAGETWLRKVSISLLGSGKQSFTGSICLCLGSANIDLIRVCLVTIAWLSHALSSISDSEFQLPAFSKLISQLKETLKHGQQVEDRVLASMCLLNFSQIPECRVLLTIIAKEIADSLRALAEVTWTSRKLYAVLSGEEL